MLKELMVLHQVSWLAQEQIYSKIRGFARVAPVKYGQPRKTTCRRLQFIGQHQPTAFLIQRHFGAVHRCEVSVPAQSPNRCLRKSPLGENHYPFKRQASSLLVLDHPRQSQRRFLFKGSGIGYAKLIVSMVTAVYAD